MKPAPSGRRRRLCPGRHARPGQQAAPSRVAVSRFARLRNAAPVAVLLAAVGACASTLHASPAAAAGTIVEVRVEGRSTTLFEGPVRTEGHDVQASSDTTPRPCDGTNAGRNPVAGPTPTAASADAMALTGQDFDGRWFGGIDDYLISRWGDEAEAEGQSWSLYANDALSNVGGCQLELHEGAEVLWKLGFATSKPLLMLTPQRTGSGAPPLTAQARPGVPFPVEVLAYRPGGESEPPAEPSRSGAGSYAGAKVAPVETSTSGVQTVAEGSAATATTGSDGIAEVTFASTGWHRLKAVAAGTVRSNRLDVCVAEAGSGCGAPPPEDEVRTVLPETEPLSPAPPAYEPPPSTPVPSTPAPPTPAGNVASVTATDTLRIDGITFAPIDDRSALIRLTGPWRRRTERGAFAATISVGGRGADLFVRLARGRPAIVTRGVARGTRVLEILGAARRTVTLARAPAGRAKLLLLARQNHAGVVELRVLSGSLGVDGVALLP